MQKDTALISFTDRLFSLRKDYLNLTYKVVSILVIPVVAISLLRIIDIGWQNDMYLHIFTALFIVFVRLFRFKLPHNFKLYSLITLALSVSSTGLMTSGLTSGTGCTMMISITILATLFGGKRVGYFTAIISIGLLFIIMTLSANEIISSNFDLNDYNKSWTSWLSTIFTFIILVAPIIYTLEKIQQHLEDDIIELKDKSIRLKLLNKEIVNQKKELSTLLDAANKVAIITATDAAPFPRITNFSAGAENMLGYTKQEALGEEVTKFHDHEVKAKLPEILQKMKEGKPGLTGEVTMIRKNGEHFPTLFNCYPVKPESGEVKHFIAVAMDISEQKKNEEARLKLMKLDSVGILAGGIAHDFNNLLAGILGSLELAKFLMGEEKSEIKDSIDIAAKGAIRATDLTQKLLTFSRGGAPVKEAHDVAIIIKETVEFVTHGSPLEINLRIDKDLKNADIDKGQICQVIENLVINAEQELGDKGKLTITAFNRILETDNTYDLPEGQYINIQIIDNGNGIKPENIPKIFDPYFTTKTKGNGLGLAVVHSIISHHKGAITVDSVLDKGTQFSILIPASKENIKIEKKESAKNTIVNKKKCRILIMDDDNVVRTIVQKMLNEFGYSCEGASNGDEAIKKYSQSPFDLVIVDLTIPGGMGGVEALRELKNIDPNVKAIVSSGYSNDPVMANYKEYGFLGRLVKPFLMEELEELIKESIL